MAILLSASYALIKLYCQDTNEDAPLLHSTAYDPLQSLQGPAPKVIHGDIFVAEKFIGWQEKSLLSLQQSFDINTKVGCKLVWLTG